MKQVSMNKTYLEGRLRIGFDDQGLRLISFKQFGIKEEGLALVFKQKDVTEKSMLRIKGLVRDFENAKNEYTGNPRNVEYLELMELLMKKLCGKIGQLEKLAGVKGNSDETILARKALYLIRDHCGVAVFQQKAERLLQEPNQQTGSLFC